MNWREKLKLGTARVLLQFSDKLLGRDPESFDKFLSKKAKQQQEERFEEIKVFEEDQQALKELEEEKRHQDQGGLKLLQEDEFLLRHREKDYDFDDPEAKSDDMIMFQAELEALIVRHLSITSGLVIAGPLVAEAMKLYRTILPQEEYDQIIAHIYQTRNNIETTVLPEDLSSKTVH